MVMKDRHGQKVVHSALNGIDYLFSNFFLAQRHKEHKESRIPINPLCPSCLCAKYNLHHLRHNVLPLFVPHRCCTIVQTIRIK